MSNSNQTAASGQDIRQTANCMTMRIFTAFIACASTLSLDASAQNYPVRPVRIIVGYAAGGSTDVTARLVAQKLAEDLGQPVIVENRPGAGGAIAIQAAAGAPADGYTLIMIAASATVLPAVRLKLPYDLERDLAPLSLVATTPSVLAVHPSLPVRTVRELITLARSKPGQLNFASDGVGTNLHLAGAQFNSMAGVNIVHVPYKSGTESAVANASGQVEMSFPSVTSSLALLSAGKLRALAVTSPKRATLLPAIPTINESGLPDFYHSAWVGMLAPAGTPKEIMSRLGALIAKAVNMPDIREGLNKQGLEMLSNTPEQFAAFIRSEIANAAKMVKLAGLKPE